MVVRVWGPIASGDGGSKSQDVRVQPQAAIITLSYDVCVLVALLRQIRSKRQRCHWPIVSEMCFGGDTVDAAIDQLNKVAEWMMPQSRRHSVEDDIVLLDLPTTTSSHFSARVRSGQPQHGLTRIRSYASICPWLSSRASFLPRARHGN